MMFLLIEGGANRVRSNDEIIEIIREQLNNKDMSISELARRTGMSKSAISRYMNKSREFPINRINDFAKALNLDSRYILGFNEDITTIYDKLIEPRQKLVYKFAERQLDEQNKVISIEETQTVYLNSKLSAGTGILDLDPTDTKEIEYLGYVPKHDLAFKVCGDSMTPSFKDGEIVFVEKTPDIHNGQFIAVQINEEAFLKKAYKEEDCLRLVSLNDKYEDIVTCNGDDIRVIGRVIL